MAYFNIEEELKSYTLPEPVEFSSRAIHVGQDPKQWSSRALVPPIHTSSMYALEDQENFKYIYHRGGSPSKNVLEECFANLNDGKHALMFSSGQGATSSLLISLGAGAHVIICKYIYGHTINVFVNEGVNLGISHTFVDLSDIKALKKAIKPNTKLVFFESPSNPTLKCFDIQVISDTVHAINKNIIVAVDNSFMSPFLQRPLSLGADIAMYSCSKYVNGHSDVVMGSLVVKSDELFHKLKGVQVRVGNIPSAFDCYLVLRGLKTLAIRMRQHVRNGLIVAKFLQSHPAVARIAHPGLKTDPSHAVSVKQSCGHCGMICFWLKGANLEQNKATLKQLKHIKVATSLGGIETLALTPFVVAAANHPRELKEDVGITENCVRLSVGLEDPQMLINDLNQALNTLKPKM